jgi:hypothetical protein
MLFRAPLLAEREAWNVRAMPRRRHGRLSRKPVSRDDMVAALRRWIELESVTS